MSVTRQLSFSGGEVSPALYGRVDLQKYQSGLKTLSNFVVARHGGLFNRAGFQFVGEIKDSTYVCRLVKFVFNNDQTYMLEFGHLTMRVIRNGAYLSDLTKTITAVSSANPAVVTYSGADDISNGQEVAMSEFGGAMGDFLNGRNFKIANVNAGANTFELQYLDGTNVNTTAVTAFAGSAFAKRIYTIVSPYSASDLSTLQYAQSGDVITFTHPSYAPQNLSRTGHTSWTFAPISFVPSISRPTNISTNGTAGGVNIKYKVTAVKAETYEESLVALAATQTLTSITKANPAVVTYVGADTYVNGDQIYITGSDMTEVNGNYYTIANVNAGANTFELQGIDSSGYAVVGTTGNINRTHSTFLSVTLSSANPSTTTWVASAGAVEYNVYKEANNSGIFGFIGIAQANSFTDPGITPDTSDTAPDERNPFEAAGDYPSCVGYFQQRRIYANTNNNPESVYASRTGQFNNFTVSSPIQDDDAVTWTMAGRQVNEVRHIIDIGELIMFTASGEWAVGGNDAGILLPGAVNPKQHSYNGASEVLPPIIINGNALYGQARGSVIRDLGFDQQIDGYRGNDLTIFSNHLFDNYTLLDWDYQQIPHSVVWVVRDDGKLLGLTYVREHQIWAWHVHETDGIVENACVIPEGNEDFLYIVVKRTIDGEEKKYVERMSTRLINEVEDCKLLDSFLTYDGRNTNTATKMRLTGGTTWAYDESIVVECNTSFFSTTLDVGKQVHITLGDEVIRVTLIADAGNSPTEFLCRPNRTVPVSMRDTYIETWSLAVNTVGGLWHLEDKEVSIFADGFVVASPNNNAYDIVTVTAGTITLDNYYGVIHVGIPYTSDIETLNIDTVQGETLADKNKLITELTLFVQDTRGIFAGDLPPTGDDMLENLREVKIRNTEGYDDPVALTTGIMEVQLNGSWENNGRVFIRNVDPVPCSILTIVPGGYIPFKG